MRFLSKRKEAKILDIISVIDKKKKGISLSESEIDFFVKGCLDGSIQDCQASALLMAICINGMDESETSALTLAIRDSGKKCDRSGINGIIADKHSTGGVGDKTSLIVAPIVASLGLKVFKMSGRGLGHTGGTADKLESIKGFNVTLSEAEAVEAVNRTGLCIITQSDVFAPADKKLYALRDVTGTVDSIPLIASSIMGKKLALGDDCIVLDVKCGSGAFMKTKEDAVSLAELMVSAGKKAGKKTAALITDMSKPLGYAIGNSLEVIEAVDVLRGKGPEDVTRLSIELSAYMLRLAGFGDMEFCRSLAEDALKSGKAFGKFVEMVRAQGGDTDVIFDVSLFPGAKISHFVKAEKSGYIYETDTEAYGIAAKLLGAGRKKLGDVPDFSAGLLLKAKTGDYVSKGDIIAELRTSDADCAEEAGRIISSATVISDSAPEMTDLIIGIIED